MKRMRDVLASECGIILLVFLLLPGTSLLIWAFDTPSWMLFTKVGAIFAVGVVGLVFLTTDILRDVRANGVQALAGWIALIGGVLFVAVIMFPWFQQMLGPWWGSAAAAMAVLVGMFGIDRFTRRRPSEK